MSSKAIGVACSALGSVILNFGVNVQKLSHRLNLYLPVSERRPYLKQWRWWVGFAIFCFGNVGDLVALGFVSPTVTVPLGSISLVSNVYFASCLLNETITHPMLVSTFAIILGAVFTTIFSASPSDTNYSLDEAQDLFYNSYYYVYISIVSVLIVTTFVFFQYQFHLLKASSARGVVEGFDAVDPVKRFLVRFSVPCFGGLVGSQTVLFTKITVELLEYSFKESDNQFRYGLSWVFLLLAASTAVIQIHYLNVSLRSFGISYVVPVYYVVWTIASIIGAGVLFGDFSDFQTINYVMFFLGLTLVFIGVSALSIASPNVLEEDQVQATHASASASGDGSQGSSVLPDDSCTVLLDEPFQGGPNA